MKRLVPIAAILSALLILSSAAYSQGTIARDPAPINGVVMYDADNQPAARVLVQVLSISGSPIDSYFTSSDGKFSTPMLPPGQYVVKIELEGFKPYRQSLELMGYPGVRLIIMLRAIPPDKPAVTGPSVSARELGLPQGAQDALHHGTEALFQKHDAAGSLPFFQKVITMAPDFYEAAYYQGVAYMELGRKKEAQESFRSAASLSDDKFPDADFALASLLTDEKQFPDSEKLIRAGLLLQPDGWTGHYELARLLLATVKIAEAEQSALTARKLKPDFPRIYLLLANIHLQQNKNEAVLDDLNTYLKQFPNGAYVSQVKALKEKTEQAMAHPQLPQNEHL